MAKLQLFSNFYNTNREKKNIVEKSNDINKEKTTLLNKSILDVVSTETGDENSCMSASIDAKLQSGKKLSQEELNYLQRTNPIMYMRVLRVQMKRDLLEKKLKNCKSKREVEEISMFELGSIRKNDPDKILIIKALQRVVVEFKRTSVYHQLPEVKEDKGKTKSATKQELRHSMKLGGYHETLSIMIDTEDTMEFDIKS